MPFRRATNQDLATLSAIAQRSKAHWGYPAAWLDAWRASLTLRPADLERFRIELLDEQGVVGFIAVRPSKPHAELEHLWLLPAAHGRGYGRTLVEHACALAREAGARTLQIDSDPYAEPFYRHMGARMIGKTPAAMAEAPERYLPRLEIAL